jgi:transposase
LRGVDRGQTTLFPECLKDWIGEDNPARVVDVFVEELDLAELGFGGVDPEATGRPSYHPSILLKLYIYGYLNRVQLRRQQYTLQTTQQSVRIETRRPIVGGRYETY